MTRRSHLSSVPSSARSFPSPRQHLPRHRSAPARRQRSRANIFDGRAIPHPQAAPRVQVVDRGGCSRPAFIVWVRGAFSRWLADAYGSPEAVACAFDVRFQTACNWINGDNTPSGDVIAAVFLFDPHAAAWFAREWGRADV